MSRFYRILILAVSVIFFAQPLVAQTYLETYGQNRVQYRNFDWRFYETEHFRIYHYDAAGRFLARYLAEQAESDIKTVEKKLGGQFPKSFKIILYNNYDDFRQSNVGRANSSQLQDVQTGMINLAGDRMLIYFDGIHTDMRRQLRIGMSRVVMEHLLFGDNLKEMAKNALTLNLPTWVTEGYISYMVDGWNAASENEWKNLLAADPTKGFFELSEAHPEIAGKAFWKYISEKYGESLIKTMLYTMEMKGGLKDGIKLTLGQKIKVAYSACMNFYKAYYQLQEFAHEPIDSSKRVLSISVPTDNGVIRSVFVSPRGHDVAYMWYKEGEYKVILQKTQQQKTANIQLFGGAKDYNETQPDADYPVLTWSNNGYKLAMLFRKGTETRLRIYNSLKASIENYVIPNTRFDRITGITFMENDDKLVFSAIKRSQSDIYEYTIKGKRVKNITKDPWDDAQPWFVSGGARRGVLWVSNRPQPNLNVPIGVNELPVGPMNVFFYDTKTQSTTLLQCSHVKKGNASNPIQFGTDNFAYLYDSNGIRNRYVVLFQRNAKNMDSAISVPVTDYDYGILEHQYSPASNDVVDVIQEGKHINVYVKKLEIPTIEQAHQLHPATFTQTRQPIIAPVKDDTVAAQQQPALTQEDENGFSNISELKIQEGTPILKKGDVYLTEFDDNNEADNDSSTADDTKKRQHPPVAHKLTKKDIQRIADSLAALPPSVDSTYLKMRSQPYRLSFRPNIVTARLDNSILFQRYQSMSQSGGGFTTNPLSGLISVELNDVMENHKITGGIRFPISYPPNLSYFVSYENVTKRIDWSLLLFRNESKSIANFSLPDSISQNPIPLPIKNITTTLQFSAVYPLDRRRSFRFQQALRLDQLQVKAYDIVGLVLIPNQQQYWTMSRLEYVFDNAIKPTLNITKGYQYKFFGEFMYGFAGQNNGTLYSFGTDFRYYHPIYKNFILASRIAAAHSDGKNKIIYYTGGVDNWINKKTGNPTSDPSYALSMLATNLRGFRYQEFVGNTYGVINEELRFPVFSSLLKRPIQSGLLRNLQLIAFADFGGAWLGWKPVNKYYIGTNTYGNQNVVVQVNIPGRQGVSMGWGSGIRTTLLGYFIRVDAAWGLNNGRDANPLWYISFGTDF